MQIHVNQVTNLIYLAYSMLDRHKKYRFPKSREQILNPRNQGLRNHIRSNDLLIRPNESFICWNEKLFRSNYLQICSKESLICSSESFISSNKSFISSNDSFICLNDFLIRPNEEFFFNLASLRRHKNHHCSWILLFMDLLGYPYPRIYVPTNRYKVHVMTRIYCN